MVDAKSTRSMVQILFVITVSKTLESYDVILEWGDTENVRTSIGYASHLYCFQITTVSRERLYFDQPTLWEKCIGVSTQ